MENGENELKERALEFFSLVKIENCLPSFLEGTKGLSFSSKNDYAGFLALLSNIVSKKMVFLTLHLVCFFFEKN